MTGRVVAPYAREGDMFTVNSEELIGREFQRGVVASAEDAGETLVSGADRSLDVMPTDQLLRLVETSAYDFINPHLETGYRTVGVSLSFRHFAPVPSGYLVTATLKLEAIEGRKCLFQFHIDDEVETVCTGTYANYIVDICHFRDAVAGKLARHVEFKTAAASVNPESSCIELEPNPPAQSSIILLHGGGGYNGEFLSVLRHFTPRDERVRFILPNAPQIRLTLFGGARMRAWYDVLHADLRHEEDEAGIRRAARRLEELIQRERHRGIPSDRILIGGFSQGGAIALYVGARYPEPLAGVIALSSYLPLMGQTHAERPGVGCRPPVYIGHGCDDDLVPVSLSEQAALLLESLGHPTRFTTFPVGHGTCHAELESMNAWLEEALS